MILLLARCFAAAALFLAPIVIYILLSGKAESLLYLIFPLIGFIPAVILALVMFWPTELVLDRMGLSGLKNIVIPLLGAVLIFVFTFLLGALGGDLDILVQKIANKPDGMRVTMFWMTLGLAWGVAWRASDWLTKFAGLQNG